MATATLFARLAELAEALAATSKRAEMADLLAEFLRNLAPPEQAPAARLAIGQVFAEWDERALNLSWKAVTAAVGDLVEATPAVREAAGTQAVDGGEYICLLLQRARREPPRPPSLPLLEVYGTLEAIAGTSGRGARARKQALLGGLLARASAVEAKVLAKIVLGDMRHGAGEGVLLEGIARAAGVKTRLARRALQFWGDVGEVAQVALEEGEAGLKAASVRLFRPLKPMLAQTAGDMEEAFARHDGQLALEYKLDGARVQIHRQGDEVRIYSRQLADVTSSLPDVAEQVRQAMAAGMAIVEGEAVAVDGAGRPLPFQYLMRRFRRKHAVEATLAEVPVQLYLFDALLVEGQAVVDRPYAERWPALEAAAGGLPLVPRLLPQAVEEGAAFAQAAHRAGHEGVMAKALSSRYTPGVRGKSWLKLKHVISVDLAIVAAEWGYGRRHGWLSNYHLAALDPETGEYRVVGKTFKGLTDAQFEAMTQRLLSLERSRRSNVVRVEPRVVVEVLFNEIQESSQYPSGLALRFARIHRIRDDKSPADAETLPALQEIYDKQFQYKGTPPGATRS
jgi:DNA ligase-1